MATNNDGHLIDDKGNVVVDFVWGNLPMQPNDFRDEQPILGTSNYGTNLDYTLDSHEIVLLGWNGYPLYTPNNDGSAVEGDSPADGIQADERFVTVPNVLSQTTARAQDLLKDAGFYNASTGATTVTTATAATNTAVQPTRVNVTATTAATVYVASGTGAFPVGTTVTIGAGTGIPAAVVGNWLVTGGNTTTIIIAGTGWTVADSGSITPGTVLTGKSGTIKTQSIAGGNTSTLAGAAITITPWA